MEDEQATELSLMVDSRPSMSFCRATSRERLTSESTRVDCLPTAAVTRDVVVIGAVVVVVVVAGDVSSLCVVSIASNTSSMRTACG